MRIALVADNYPPDLGGIEVVVSELAQRMVLRGHEVDVFVHARSRDRGGDESIAGVTVHRFPTRAPHEALIVSPGLIAALRRERSRFDVVHAHNFHALPALAAALAGMRPLVFTPHYHGRGHSRAAQIAHVVYRPTTRLLFRACSAIVCVSAAEASALARDFPHISAPVVVIPNGVLAQAFADARMFESASDVVVAAGRMESYKQFDRVALAAEMLPPGMEVVLLGDGPARADVQQLIAQRGLEQRVRMLGRVSDDDLRSWFRSAKVLVSMSRHESFGLTVVEALAAGTPVVASDIPAHRETAAAQPSGAVRLVGLEAEPATIAQAILAATRHGLPPGVQIRTWDDVAEQVLEVYASVRDRSRSASTSRYTAST